MDHYFYLEKHDQEKKDIIEAGNKGGGIRDQLHQKRLNVIQQVLREHKEVMRK